MKNDPLCRRRGRLPAVALLTALSALLPTLVCAQEEDQGRSPLFAFGFRAGAYRPLGQTGELDWLELRRKVLFQAGFDFSFFLNRLFALSGSFDSLGPSIFNHDGWSGFKSDVFAITLTAKLAPMGFDFPLPGKRGDKIIPWFGAGIGVYLFGYESYTHAYDNSESWWIDSSSGLHIAAGIIMPLHRYWSCLFEARLAYINSDLAIPGMTTGIAFQF